MALPIITALRRCYTLQRTVLDTAIQLAHRASIYGVVRVSLRFMAGKCRCCKQTIITHLKKLIALNILRKTRTRKQGRFFFELNQYSFNNALLQWRTKESTNHPSQNTGPNLPPPEREQEKFGAIREDIRKIQNGLHYQTPGSLGYEEAMRNIAALTALLDAPDPLGA